MVKKKKLLTIVFSVAALVTKCLLLAIKWTYATHDFFRQQGKSNEENCVKLSKRVVLHYRYNIR